MNSLVLGCHPNLKSFTLALSHALAECLRQNDTDDGVVEYIDLYREQFDPVLGWGELQQHWSFDDATQWSIRLLRQSDLLAVVHPVWWAGMPALLSGWIQRVWKNEVAFRYEGEEFTPKNRRGLLSDKRVLISYVSDDATSDDSCRILQEQWQYILSFCGVQQMQFESIGELRGMHLKQRAQAIQRVCQRALALSAER